jgi:hypothetical protein
LPGRGIIKIKKIKLRHSLGKEVVKLDKTKRQGIGHVPNQQHKGGKK